MVARKNKLKQNQRNKAIQAQINSCITFVTILIDLKVALTRQF